ncbi:hypothetical protein YYC_05913 [Plasmodium yoelii 17X]|uniref:PYST-C1-like N-terminal domain-containing protein n=1 Tax=Plasmodium yoelii 17X TaxID=1323249 RepID=V7P971_PLAYE|nr:hypothetical protein YYC_05913 [Plasmodium yoelii 17X]
MNKRIFSLVCIALYTLLAVSVHCSEQKVSDVGNKSVRGIKETNKSNEKNNIKYKRETQLKSTNPKDDENDREFNCFNIFKRNKKTFKSSNKNEPLPKVPSDISKDLEYVFVKNPEILSLFLHLKKELEKGPSKHKPNK